MAHVVPDGRPRRIRERGRRSSPTVATVAHTIRWAISMNGGAMASSCIATPWRPDPIGNRTVGAGRDHVGPG